MNFTRPYSACFSFRRRGVTAVLSLLLSSAFLTAQKSPDLPQPAAVIDEDQGLTGFGLALRKLGTTGSILYLTAHPDDENNAALAWMSRGLGLRGALMSLTRGDGGQNEIGPELFEALGVLRTEELASIHRMDGFRQYFSRAFEFGYSFNVEETFQKWGREEIVSDIVRLLRLFRPMIVITLSPEGTGGGQHHQASALLALEAYRRAGDPSQFPEQIREGLRPWQPVRLFQAGSVGMGGADSSAQVRVQLGGFDPLLGETYGEFGARARGHHRSQGMNVLPEPGPMSASFRLAENRDGEQHPQGLFDGLQIGLDRISAEDPGLETSMRTLQTTISAAQTSFSASDTSGALKAVVEGLRQVRKALAATGNPEALFLLQQEESDFQEACEKGLYVAADAQAVGSRDGKVAPGEEFRTRVRFSTRSDVPVDLIDISLSAPTGWTVAPEQSSENTRFFTVRVGADAEYSGPYWYRPSKQVNRFATKPGFSGIEENAPPPLLARIRYRVLGEEVLLERPIEFRRFNPSTGLDSWAELRVVPEISTTVSPHLALVRLDAPHPLRFEVKATNEWPGSRQAKLLLEVPDGWTVEPEEAELLFSFENEVRSLRFTVTPQKDLKPGALQVKVVAVTGGRESSASVEEIEYPHIRARQRVETASASIRVLDARIPEGLRVGYIMGVGDDVGEATAQLGAGLTYLDEQELNYGDLDRFDVIVTGVRAYWARPDLIAANQRLLDYVRRGGHLVVQYNKYEYLEHQYAPYPLKIRSPHDRVTVEESPVKVLVPGHPVFNLPNRIDSGDWDGWVQERGLYFLGEWDSHYQPLLELQDPWPYNNEPKRGALVVAKYGSGSYIYTGLAFFRQLPEGVPGAFRLWANLISLGWELKHGGASLGATP